MNTRRGLLGTLLGLLAAPAVAYEPPKVTANHHFKLRHYLKMTDAEIAANERAWHAEQQKLLDAVQRPTPS